MKKISWIILIIAIILILIASFFLLSKNPHYYFDNASIKEPLKGEPETRNKKAEGYHYQNR
jgi:uncharacterized protein YxeA